MTNDIEPIKRTPKYWRNVGNRALQSALKDAGMKNKALLLGVSAAIFAVAWLLSYIGIIPVQFFDTQAQTANSAINAFFYVVLAFIVVVVAQIWNLPALIDGEKAAEILKLKKHVTNLEDTLRPKLARDEEIFQLQQSNEDLKKLLEPKLALWFDPDDTNSAHVFPGGVTVYRVKIKNTGLQQVRDIKVKIQGMQPASYGNLPLELHIMNDASDTLNPSETALVDVVEFHAKQGSTYMFFYGKKGNTRIALVPPFHDHELTISASAANSPPVEGRFHFSVRSFGPEFHPAFTQLA